VKPELVDSILDKFNLCGRKAIVTGGTTGLGRGMVEALAEAGASVVVIDISEKAELVSEESYCHRVHGIRADLGNRSELRVAFEKAVELLGGTLDILVNNAGVQRRNVCEDFSESDWDYVIQVNLSSVFLLSQLAGRLMLKKGKGKIINMASMLSFFGGYTVPAYAASKGGVAQLTKALSNEWASKGINVNAIAPGYMDTAMNTALKNDADRSSKILNRIPAKRWGVPDDIKGLVVFLASGASDYINGAIIPLDGGYLGC
jgi:2-deoxy-D-gluconate 3-dehydrogenase